MELYTPHAIAIVIVCAACTFLERALPFAVFRGRTVPKIIQYLGTVLPMAIMATLVIYCIKDISFSTPSGFVPYLSGIAVTAILHLWRRNVLLSIAGGTVFYMLLVQWIF